MRLDPRFTRARWLLAVAALGALGAGCSGEVDGDRVVAQTAAFSVDPPVVISQVYGGGSNSGATYTHDFVELFNRSNGQVALDTLSLQYGSGAGTGNIGITNQLATFPVGATIDSGRYYLVQLAGPNPTSVGAPLPAPDATPTPINLSGTAGKIALVTGTTGLGCNGSNNPCNAMQIARIIDFVGYGGANYSETAPTTPALNNQTSALRDDHGCTDTNNNSMDFQNLSPPQPRNGATAAAPCDSDQAPNVVATSPIDGATEVDPDTTVEITFSEPVAVAGSWFAFECTLSGTVTAAVSGGPTVFTLTPASALADADSCEITISAADVSDLDLDDPPDAPASDYSFDFTVAAPLTPLAVHTVQGAGHLSPYASQILNVGPAVVTVLKSNGFFMQSETPDASDATSEGIFVFTSAAPSVTVGNLVTVRGTIAEFRPGCSSCAPSSSAFDNLTTTEMTGPTITVLGTGQPLPAPVVLGAGPGERTAPLQVIDDDSNASVEASGGTFDPDADGIDFYESLEGMRVQLNDAQVIDPTRSFAGGSMEIGVLARADAGLRTARGGIIIAENDFNPERVFLDNTLVPQFPLLDVGDSFDGAIVGVVDYTFANYKVVVISQLPPVIAGGLAHETTALVPVTPRQLAVGSINVENLDALDPPAKFAELAAILVDNMGAPDLIALEEVQDDNGPTSNGVVSAAGTLQALIDAIATADGPAYAYRQIDPENNQDGGEPGGNIRVAFLFRTDRGLAFVDRGMATATTPNAVDTTSGSPQLVFSPGRLDPLNGAFASSRKPLAAEFTFEGETFFVIANHFNSKGGDDPLFGRFQPPVLSSESQRMAQAAVVAGFVDTLLDADPDAFVLVLGDLNDFSFSPPLEALEAVGLIDLGETLPAPERYTYVFQGNSQDLDHIMISPALAPRVAYDIVHVNAEFAEQASDHDPSVARIDLGTVPSLAMGSDPAPVFTGGSLAFQVTATGSPAPSFALIDAPAGMTIDTTTGLVSWPAAGAPGVYSFTVQASNYAGSVSRVYSLTVLGAPGVPALPPSAALALFVGLLAAAGLRRAL